MKNREKSTHHPCVAPSKNIWIIDLLKYASAALIGALLGLAIATIAPTITSAHAPVVISTELALAPRPVTSTPPLAPSAPTETRTVPIDPVLYGQALEAAKHALGHN